MADETSRRHILAAAIPASSVALAGHAARDPRGDVALTVYNHRESAVTVAVEIERDDEVTFSQTVSLPGDPDEHSGSEIEPALRNVENGDRFAVRTTIDAAERYRDRFTAKCAADSDVGDRISIVVSSPDVKLLQNDC